MRESIFPITILQQLNGSLHVKVNDLHDGYQYLNYHLAESDKLHRRQLDEKNEFVINDFSEGPGHYYFYLSDEENNCTSLHSVYITKDSDLDVYKKIISYIASPVDESYMKSILANISKTNISYAYQLGQELSKVEKPQEFEQQSFYQLISAAERYENTLAITHNRTNVRGVVCHYGSKFGISVPSYVSSMEVFEYHEGMAIFGYKAKVKSDTIYPVCTPGRFYRINLYADTDLIISLVHYQLEEAGMAYIWQQQMDFLEQQQEREQELDRTMLDDTELAYSGIELTADDKDRILEERHCQPRNYLIERVKVSPHALDPKILEITIPNFGALSGSTYYLSVTERDILNESMFDLRFKVAEDHMQLDTRKELLDDELLFCIRDSQGNIVSKYTRYTMQENMTEYMSEYSEKLNAVEVHEYVEQLLSKFSEAFENSDICNSFLDIVMPLTKGTTYTVGELKNEIILATGYSQKLHSYRDNILFFINDNWLNQFTYDAAFFAGSKPVFYYTENRLVMPRIKDEYILVTEYYDIPNKKSFVIYVASKDCDHGISVPVNKADLCCTYAINTKTKYRSGFILFNNFGTKNYYRDHIELEVNIYNG